ncbi:Hypothetical protein, putative [Bodo saltans]|uniref:AAA+ ATPase domain-containing protein n=1 Tax=Bodo saltans TaxID=75058 RepID=A0A0S4JKA6_BODSA|nr:Hypothetical protein, putative [Bodo saltans]|eukprot:CUG90389.1 Hypothetical protein, putative [Bodo saltans]
MAAAKAKGSKEGPDPEEVWKVAFSMMEKRTPRIDVFKYMSDHCTTDIPTVWFGMKLDGDLKGFIKDLLSTLEVQLWWNKHKLSICTDFYLLVQKWMQKFEIVDVTNDSSWKFKIKSVLACYAASRGGDVDIIRKTLNNAIRDINDVHKTDANLLENLARLVNQHYDEVYAEVSRWTEKQTYSKEVPVVVGYGILRPLITRLSAAQFDVLILKFIHLGGNTERRWWKESVDLLDKELLRDWRAVAIKAVKEKEMATVWKAIARQLNSSKMRVIPSIAEWWASNAPSALFAERLIDKAEGDRFDLALKFAKNGDLLTIRDQQHVDIGLAQILEARLDKASVTPRSASIEKLTRDLNEALNVYTTLIKIIESFPSLTTHKLVWTPLVEPYLPQDVPMRNARVESDDFQRAIMAERNSLETLKEILAVVQQGTKEREIELRERVLRGITRPKHSTDVWRCFTELLKALRETVDSMSIDELIERDSADAEWCRMQGVPTLHSWIGARDLLKAVVAFVEAARDPTPGCAKIVVVEEHGLLRLLKASLEFTTGRQYREFEKTLLQKYSRTFPQGVTKEVMANLLDYCSAERKGLRDFRELNIHGLKRKFLQSRSQRQGESANKSIASISVLAATMPMRLKGDHLDAYSFEELCRGLHEANQRHPALLSELTEKRIADINEVYEQLEQANKNSNDSLVIERMVFECQTVEDYDSNDGVPRSFHISIKAPNDDTREVKRYDSDQIGTMLADAGVSKAARSQDLDHFATVVPLLRRLVEIGVHCLVRGYREVLECILSSFPNTHAALKLESHKINGRSTGFKFGVWLREIDTTRSSSSARCTTSELSDMIGHVGSECEMFISSIQRCRGIFPVMNCFDSKDIGHILSIMLQEPSEQSAEALTNLVVQRLGTAAFDMKELQSMRREDMNTRLEKAAQVLTKASNVVSEDALLAPPIVLFLNDASSWPLAVANLYRDTTLAAFQLCLPMGSESEIFSARESFLRRVRSGVCPRKDPCSFCLVIPEYTANSSETFSLLKEECCPSRLPLYIIVHSSLVEEGRASFFSCNAMAANVAPFELFKPKASRIGAVVGPSRSGKVAAAKLMATKEVAKPNVGVVLCDRFLSESTQPHELHNLLEAAGTQNTAIIEIGAGGATQLQPLIFSLCLEIWSSRDGVSVRRKNSVVLKVHTALFNELPVLQLMHKTRTEPRISASLNTQFQAYVNAALSNPSQDLTKAISEVGRKLAKRSELPLSAPEWISSNASVETHRVLRTATELPEYLLTFAEDKTAEFYAADDQSTQKVSVLEYTHKGGRVPWKSLKNQTSDELWQVAFRILGTPVELRVAPGLVMTPSILQTLIRFDLSVKCRQATTKREDDGVVTFVGETGSGKTQLVDTYCRYRGWSEPKVIHVSTGTTEADIVNLIHKFHENYRSNRPAPTVIFFDEFNTSPAQDMIKRIMLDRYLPGVDERFRHLPSTRDGWIFVAACNPYDVLATDRTTGQRVLKYTVQHHISPSLSDSCWRLPLPTSDEEKSIVRSMCTKCGINKEDTDYFAETVPAVHKYLGDHADMVPCSLRTVSRLLRLYLHLDRITCLDAIADENVQCKHTINVDADNDNTEIKESPIPQDHLAPLALAANYFVALSQEKRTELQRTQILWKNGKSLQVILDEFGEKLRPLYTRRASAVQSALPTDLLRTASLNESLAVTYLCVYSQTPLLLIGPPGSSKTLATFMVVWGELRASQHLRLLEEPLYFQCSTRTSAHSVKALMNDVVAHRSESSTLVQVFDEIGCADQAVGHPMRVLNEYLERSVFKKDGKVASVMPTEPSDHWAVLATSNYFLDRSLLGRAIILQRDNPTVDELKEMFPTGSNEELIRNIRDHLTDVEAMQSQTNALKTHNTHNNKLTMRDIYSLLAEKTIATPCLRDECSCNEMPNCEGYCCPECKDSACPTQNHICLLGGKAMDILPTVQRPAESPVICTAILKTMGMRGASLLGGVAPRIFNNVQLSLLSLRFKHILNTIHKWEAQRNAPQVELAGLEVQQSTTFYQSRQRPLMVVADKLSTIYEALAQNGLREYTDVIYGQFLVGDDQMITTTMLQLREAMVTPGRVCLLVDCERLIDSLLDVFNGFFQCNGGPEMSVRVVLEGRSDYWPVEADFSSRFILAVVDDTPSFNAFTPAVESRFEKLYLRADLFTSRPHIKEFDAKVATLKTQYLGALPTTLDSRKLQVCQGYHPLMMSMTNNANIDTLLLTLLLRPDVVAKHTTLAPDVLEAISEVVSLQSKASVVKRFLEQDKNSLILCPVKRCADETFIGELQSLAKAKELLGHVARELKKVHRIEGVRTLSLRSATSDMLFDIAIHHTLSITKTVAVIAISHSASSPLTATRLLAVCHAISAAASECHLRVMLFAPCFAQIGTSFELTLPPKWSVSFCEEINPSHLKPNVEQQQSGMNRLTPIHNASFNAPDIFDESKPQIKKYFDKSVRGSIADVSLEHLKRRCNEGVSTPQIIAEVKEYERLIIGLRWKLSLHYSNHSYFSRHRMDVNAGWARISPTVGRPTSVNFLLSPALDGGLPTADCLTRLQAPATVERERALANLRGALMPKDKPPTVSHVDEELLITQARLSGGQSHYEILKMVKLTKESNGRLTLPFSPMQVAMLRHFVSMSSTHSHPVVEPNTIQLMVTARDDVDTPLKVAIALARAAPARVALARAPSEPPLSRIRVSAVLPTMSPQPGREPKYGDNIANPNHVVPSYSDIYVRLALTFGHAFAKELYCHQATPSHGFSIERDGDENALQRQLTMDADVNRLEYPNDVIYEHIVHHDRNAQQSLRCRVWDALERHFKWCGNETPIIPARSAFDGIETQEMSCDDEIIPRELRSVRDELFAVERDCGLPWLGQYVQLVRAMHEQLFVPAPNGQIIGAVTLEMMQQLTVASLPTSLQEFLGTFISEAQDMNVLEAYNVVREQLVTLIGYHNYFLKTCDRLFRRDLNVDDKLLPIPARPEVQWPFVTPHHLIISTELLDEVLMTSGDRGTLQMLNHLDEALVGIPFINVDAFLSEIGGNVFIHEPTPLEMFEHTATRT